MSDEPPAAEVDISVPGRAIGEPTRGRMLTALLGKAAMPAGDLARVAGVSASTASEHLRLLVDQGLVTVTRSGRHRYYTLADADVARALEALQAIAPGVPVRSLRQHRVAADLRAGRSCYDHLAGDLGLRVTDLLLGADLVQDLHVGHVGTFVPADSADPVAATFCLDRVTDHPRRAMVRGCLDWTGRRPHVAGRLGSHLLDLFTDRGWVTPRPSSRALRLTGDGETVLASLESAG